MTQDLIKEEEFLRGKLREFLLGNEPAVSFCLGMLKSVHFWDDVADGEKLSKMDISGALITMMWEPAINPFYRAFQDQLVPIMVNAMLCWQDANVLDYGSEHDMHISYGLRSAGIQVIAFCAFLIGGIEWIKKVGPSIRRLLIEDLHEYVKEMKVEIKQFSTPNSKE